jgi:hypothetical protein
MRGRLQTPIVQAAPSPVRPTRNLWPNSDFSEGVSDWYAASQTTIQCRLNGWGPCAALYLNANGLDWVSWISTIHKPVNRQDTTQWHAFSIYFWSINTAISAVIPWVYDQDDNQIAASGEGATIVGEWVRKTIYFQVGAGDTAIRVLYDVGQGPYEYLVSAPMLELTPSNSGATRWTPDHIGRRNVADRRDRLRSLVRRQYRYVRGRR